MKNPLQFYVFIALLISLLVVSFSCHDRSRDQPDPDRPILDKNYEKDPE